MSVIFLLIFLLLLVAYSWQMLLLRRRWKEVPGWEIPKDFQPQTKVTILIPVRNEAGQIRICLQALVAQSYPSELLELILIDDHSTDQTVQLAKDLRIENMEILQLSPDQKGKKDALSYGVSEARGELILCTDGDCTADPFWVAGVVSFFETHQPKMICGAVRIAPVDSIFTRFQALDMIGMMGLTAVGVETGEIRLCNGANMAYRKDAFLKVGGYDDIRDAHSGDDVLLLEKMQSQFPDEVNFLKMESGLVSTNPAKTGLDFLRQRLRWAAKTTRKPHVPTLILSALVTGFCLSVLLSLFLIPKFGIFPFLIMLIGKFLVDYLFLYEVCTYYGRRALLKEFFISQAYHTVYWVLVGLGSLLISTSEWKDRKIQVK